MTMRMVAALASLGAGAVIACAAALAETVSDADVLAITRKHCVMCHAAQPTHDAVREAPKNMTLETIGALKMHAALIEAQTVTSRAMPLGNESGMTEAERATLGRWIAALK